MDDVLLRATNTAMIAAVRLRLLGESKTSGDTPQTSYP